MNKNSHLGDLSNPRLFHDPVEVNDFPIEYYLDAIKDMKVIRKVEDVLGVNVEKGIIKCPCHLSIGQEAIPVGIAHFLTKNDYVFGNHRSHGHFLSMSNDVRGLFAETLGKQTGTSKGMGGSMHVIAKKDGFHGSVPIVSATVPVAVGAALTSKLKGEDTISVSYFGDGTTEEGTFHESLNLASFYQLPVLFVCENNLFSSHMHIDERQPFDSVKRFADSNNIPAALIDGNDINEVFKVSQKSTEHLRSGKGPFFIEALTYRWRGHVGYDENIDVGLRRKDDLGEWKKRDPISRLEKSLLNHGFITEKQITSQNNEINSYINNQWEKALEDPYPKADQLFNTVYS